MVVCLVDGKKQQPGRHVMPTTVDVAGHTTAKIPVLRQTGCTENEVKA